MAEVQRFVMGGQAQPVLAETFSVKNPYTGTTLAEMAIPQEIQIDAAINLAAQAEKIGKSLSVRRRKEILQKLSQKMLEQREELASLIVQEVAKPIALARGEVDRAAETCSFAAEEVDHVPNDFLDLSGAATGMGRFGAVRHVAAGPAVLISPFNFPLNLAVHKLAPAIAAGCPAILKPSPKAPLTALRLAQLAYEAGLPDAMLSVLPIVDPAHITKLAADPRIKVVSFTGSAAVGWSLRTKLARQKTVLELGGDAACLVCADVPDDMLPSVAKRLVMASFAYAGQVCISLQRLYIHHSKYQKLLDAFRDEMAQITKHDPTDVQTLCSVMIDDKSKMRAQTWIDEAISQGATQYQTRCQTRYQAPDCRDSQGENLFLAPTLLENVPASCLLAQEEAFAPVVWAKPFTDLDQAICEINASKYGLQVGVYTDAIHTLWRCYEEIQVGAVVHNDAPIFRVDQMPYGGVKDSGMGREGVRDAILDYLDKKMLILKP